MFQSISDVFESAELSDGFNRRPVLYELLFFTGILEIPVLPHVTSCFCPSLRCGQYLCLFLPFLHRWKSFIRTWIHSSCHCGSPPPGYTLLLAQHTRIHSLHEPTKGRQFSIACLHYRDLTKIHAFSTPKDAVLEIRQSSLTVLWHTGRSPSWSRSCNCQTPSTHSMSHVEEIFAPSPETNHAKLKTTWEEAGLLRCPIWNLANPPCQSQSV